VGLAVRTCGGVGREGQGVCGNGGSCGEERRRGFEMGGEDLEWSGRA
jgi:hypothetical protein